MTRVKVTNMLKFYTICLLTSGPKHGYDLIKELEEKFGRRISASSVYPFLDTLRKNKLIKFNRIDKRDKKVYHMTADGKNFAKQMFGKFGHLINIAIEPNIYKCPCGCRIYAGGHIERVKGKIMKFCCQHCAKTYR
ncbi:MAG: PadR family transcriptional regulator [Nanoarchaeota archaeon]